MPAPHDIRPKRSIQRQLIAGVAGILALLMTVFIVDLAYQQREFLRERSSLRVLNLARATAAASRKAVDAVDVDALRATVRVVGGDDGARYAIFVAPDGRVLADSTGAADRQALTDPVLLAVVRGAPSDRTFLVDSTTIAAACPVIVDGRLVGWFFAANDLRAQQELLQGVLWIGWVHALAGIAIGGLLAFLLARLVTRPLHLLLEGARRFAAGAPYEPIPLTTENEVGVVTEVFNEAVATVVRQRRTLEDQNHFMREVADALPVQISYVDAGERYGYNNRAYFDWFGIEPSELLGKTVREVIGEEAYVNVGPHIQAALRGERVTYENVLSTPLKPERQVRVHYIPHVGPDAKVLGFFALIFDVTEANLSQRTLMESEHRFRTLADSSAVMIWMSAPDGARLYFNKTWLVFTGQELEDELGEGWLRGVHPEDLEMMRRVGADAHEKQSAFSIQFRLRQADGSFRWLLNSGVPRFGGGGDYLGHVGSAVDINARKQVEEELLAWKNRYEAAVRASGQLLYDWDPVTNEIAWAGDTDRILGISLKDLGRHIDDWNRLIHPEDRERFQDEVERLASEGGAARLHYRVRHSSGRYIHVEDRGDFVYDECGVPERMIGFVEDITERKVAEFMLQGLTETLEKRVAERTAEAEQRAADLHMMAIELTQAEQRERRRMAQILHDDLQQLVAVAKLRIGRLRSADWEEGEGVREIVDQTDLLLTEVIQTARTLSLDLSPPILQDRGLGAALEWLGRKFEQEQELLVHVRVEQGVSSNDVDTDLFLLQSVRELLFNVVKHANSSAAQITARLKDSGEIEVAVEDRGRGFDPAGTDYRASAEHFGLFNIRQRISFLGGNFRVESSPGAGARVLLSLPVRQDQREPEVQIEQPATHFHVPETTVPREKLRVLVVDDHQIVRQGLVGLLSGQPDIEVVAEAADGATAVVLAGKTAPSVIIMDISMPGMNGIEATRIIHQAHPEIAIIGLSMHEAQDMAAAMRDVGGKAFLSKGGPAQVLIDTVREMGAQGQVQQVQ